MNAKHTPGPWLQFGRMISADLIIDRPLVCYVAETEDSIANGYLIAAAPDLLRELKRLTLIVHPDEMNRYPGVRAECLAAIAKAEGRPA